jgi:hypothetical protein
MEIGTKVKITGTSMLPDRFLGKNGTVTFLEKDGYIGEDRHRVLIENREWYVGSNDLKRIHSKKVDIQNET